MERLTEYDEVAECYKIRQGASVNVVQQFGKYETAMERLFDILDKYNLNELSSVEAWTYTLELLDDFMIKEEQNENQYNG